MMLLLCLAGIAAAASVLVGGTAWRVLARRDHRCAVVSRPAACAVCEAMLDGHGAGGHVVCACGEVSPHLLGPELLRWRADHQGMRWPTLPAEGARRVRTSAAPEAGPDAELDRLGEDVRREIARSRRNPDPRTPEVLREAQRGDVNQS